MLEKLYRKSGVFAWHLRKQTPENTVLPLPDLWRGNAQNGANILHDQAALNTDEAFFSSCDWIKDVQTYGGTQARIFIRQKLDIWMQRHSRWSYQHWQPDILAKRLLNLMFSYNWFASSASAEFQQALIQSMVIQRACLSRDWSRIKNPMTQLTALTALITVQVALIPQNRDETAETETKLDRLVEALTRLTDAQLFADGGHISRQPETHYTVLQRLIECRTALGLAKMPPPVRLENHIQNMGRMIKFWRKPEMGFPHFHFAGRLHPSDIDLIIGLSAPKGGIANRAVESGFCRLSSARTCLIMDTGASQTNQHINPAGRMSFELSVGGVPVIVNSGQTASNHRLNAALCQTAAHSTLGLDNHDSDSLSGAGRTITTSCEVGEADTGQLCQATHDGYEKSHGILHTRSVFLAQSGKDIRGSDRLVYTGKPGEIPHFAVIRFHLHPRITAAMTGNQQVLLKLPRIRNRWMFKSTDGELSLEPSVYLEAGIRQNCQQIVLRLPLHDIQTVCEKAVNWAIRIYKSPQ